MTEGSTKRTFIANRNCALRSQVFLDDLAVMECVWCRRSGLPS
jgi:hypothetical protein